MGGLCFDIHPIDTRRVTILSASRMVPCFPFSNDLELMKPFQVKYAPPFILAI